MIGRRKETAELQRVAKSKRSEFVIVYGRRRVGKTYLVNEVFGDSFSFYFTGGHKLSKKRQLANFAQALQLYSDSPFLLSFKDWFDAFQQLTAYLKTASAEKWGKKIVFFDEMPWIDTPKSEFVAALENFWNSWATQQNDILFIASGSATSWMTDKLIENQGGLHNRITSRIYLRPFNLREVEEYLADAGCPWDRFQVVQCYMILGGIPFYLSLLNPSWSLVQNIDELFFAPNGALRDEFSELYDALFTHADKYITIIKALFTKKEGMTRKEIIQHTGFQGSMLTKMLSNLCKCDFLIEYSQFGKARNSIIYRLADFYTLFYLRYIENDQSKDFNRWSHLTGNQSVSIWQGLTFELVCLVHLQQIKQSLGISGVLTNASVWRGDGAQIDLVIDRNDRIVNLCEMKFSQEPYIISAEYATKLRTRTALFREASKCKKGLVVTFVTTFGVLPGKNSGVVQNEVTMDALFE